MISLHTLDAASISHDSTPDPVRILLAWRGYFAKLNVARHLRRQGYLVDIAHDAKGILNAIKNNDYACILLDVEMPGMNGVMTARYIRQNWRDHAPSLLGRIDSPYHEDQQAIIDHGGMDACVSPHTGATEVISLIARLIASRI